MFTPALCDFVFLIDGLRTPIGHPHKGLRDFSAAQLASLAIQGLLQRNNIGKELIDEVILGNAVSAGTGQNLARQSAIGAGLPPSIPAFTVNSVCGAGLQAVVLAAQSIAAKNDGLTCPITGQRMGELMEVMADKYGISREEQDDYAFESHRKACRARQQNKFKQEIVVVRGKKKAVCRDEHPRGNLNCAWLEKLPPVFGTGGTVTAGNASLSCDGAAAVITASSPFVKRHKLRPRGRILSYVSVGVEPQRSFESTVEAIRACLGKSGMRQRDVDLFELSEAFAAQIIFARKKLNIPPEKINIFGGDLAVGHPLGASGTRILVTLMNALHDRKKKKGLACVAYGGGGAIAMIIEAVS